MNTTTELLNQLNDMQSKHIETLEARIKVLRQTITLQDSQLKEVQARSERRRVELCKQIE